MKTGLARGLLVVAVFALVATVTATSHYLADAGPLPPPAASLKPLDVVFWSAFRYYLAWAISAPLIFWLARKVPIARGRWRWPVAFHILVPVLAALPFFTFRVLLNSALTLRPPPLGAVALFWRDVLPAETLSILPVYWLLLAAAMALQMQRDAEVRRVRDVQLQRSLADAQLDALRMKLQPHFLFDTLNAIGSLARREDTEAVVQAVDHLGALLRLSMEGSGRQLVTLDEELVVLDAFLAVEEVRRGERLVVARRVDPDVRQALVPSLILQPLVENALVHGIGGRLGDASVLELSASQDRQRRLELSVRDDKPGLPGGSTPAPETGGGLANLVERLRALYGDRATLEIERAPGQGTIARLILPLEAAPAPAGAALFHRADERGASWSA